MAKKKQNKKPAKKHSPKNKSVDNDVRAALTYQLKQNASHKRKTCQHSDWKHTSLDELVLKHGSWCTPQKHPEGIKRARAKQCYCNAFNLFQNNPDHTYVEGFARAREVARPHARVSCVYIGLYRAKLTSDFWHEAPVSAFASRVDL